MREGYEEEVDEELPMVLDQDDSSHISAGMANLQNTPIVGINVPNTSLLLDLNANVDSDPIQLHLQLHPQSQPHSTEQQLYAHQIQHFQQHQPQTQIHHHQQDNHIAIKKPHSPPQQQQQQLANASKGLLPLPAAQMKRVGGGWPDKERLEKVETAEQRVRNDTYDSDAWMVIITEAQIQPIDKVRETYERFLGVFPTAGRYWKSYAEQEMAARNFDNVEKIFSRCLTKFWGFVPNIDLWRCYINYVRIVKGEQGEARKGIEKVFEFALEHMGMDISSTQIWQDYLTFLKAEKATTPYEEGQKMTAIRKLYQRAVENPMHNLEAIWKEYDTFENGLNKTLAESLLKEYSPKYSAARRVYRDRKALMEGILRNMLARPPHASPKEEAQVILWRKLLTFEKSNPQNLDAIKLRARVTFTYNQCLLCLYHHPDMWLEAASFQMEVGSFDAATELFDRSLAALPSCLLIHFAYADFLEAYDKVKAKEVYERLLVSASHEPLVYIQYMRFSRRTEEDRTLPRKIFAKVKATCSYHVYVALANIEFKVNNNKDAARAVFEAGFSRFSNEPLFIQHYIDFMLQVGDFNNTRAFLEKVLCSVPNDKAQDVWNSFLAFEYTSAPDINSIVKLEKRKVAAFPNSDPNGVFALVNRYKYLGLWPCTANELEAFNYSFSTGKPETNIQADEAYDRNDNPALSRFPRPDVSCMIVYNPEMAGVRPVGAPHSPNLDGPGPMIPFPATHTGSSTPMPQYSVMSNGPPPTVNLQQSPSFPPHQIVPPFPDFLVKFISLLPPAPSYQGPLVDVDEMLLLLRDTALPPLQQPPLIEPQPLQPTRSVSPSPHSKSKLPAAGKRKTTDSDSDEELEQKTNMINKPPPQDIYRFRQAAKFKNK